MLPRFINEDLYAQKRPSDLVNLTLYLLQSDLLYYQVGRTIIDE
jgi:hypothetical protein